MSSKKNPGWEGEELDKAVKASVGSDQQEAKRTWQGEEKEQQEGIYTLQAKGLPGCLISTGLYGN